MSIYFKLLKQLQVCPKKIYKIIQLFFLWNKSKPIWKAFVHLMLNSLTQPTGRTSILIKHRYHTKHVPWANAWTWIQSIAATMVYPNTPHLFAADMFRLPLLFLSISSSNSITTAWSTTGFFINLLDLRRPVLAEKLSNASICIA